MEDSVLRHRFTYFPAVIGYSLPKYKPDSMANALAIRCRSPGEFIASVVERHRGFPLPESEDEKTYLVFIGLGDEEGILELIPRPDVEFVGFPRDLERSGLYSGEETARYLIRYVSQDEDADDTYDNEEKYYNDNSDEEAETNADEWPVENSPPLFQMQRGSNEGVRTRGNLGFKNLTRGYRAADDGEEELGEITGEGFVEQLSQLSPNPLHGPDNMGDEDGGALFGNTNDIDKPIASQEILGVEQYHDVINDSRCDSNQTIQEQKIELDEINDRESARFPAASEDFPQLPVFILRERAGSPAPDGASCTNSSPSSPRLQFEVVGEPGETDKEDGGSDEEKESNGFTSDGKKTPCEPILERRKFGFHGVEEKQQRCHAVDKAFPQAPSLCRQSKLRVLEPGSPISPRPDEISPLTTPSNSSLNLNPNEGSFVQWEEGDLAEGDEDETPPYPAKTIQNLIATEHVKIVYLEDLEALHGFLEAMMFSRTVSTRNSPLLAIWGLVGAHYQTNYFGGEGIGETVARAVETAAKSGRLLVLGEGYILVDYGNGEDEMQEQCWVDLEVPILNMGSMVVGRTVEVRQILRRWCRFGEDLEGEEDEEESEEEREHKNEDDDGDGDNDSDGDGNDGSDEDEHV